MILSSSSSSSFFVPPILSSSFLTLGRTRELFRTKYKAYTHNDSLPLWPTLLRPIAHPKTPSSALPANS